MKKLSGLLALTLSTVAFAAPKAQWLTVDNQVLAKIRPKLNKSVQTVFSAQGASVVKLTAEEVEQLSEVIHHELNRCGGFMAHESQEEAVTALSQQGEMYFAKSAIFSDYTINQATMVRPMVSQVAEPSIRDMILKLSNFNTRYYKSDTGVKSSEFIRDVWAGLARNRNDVTVELFKHKNWPQASIIMTIQGSERPNEVVVLGGHADSIAGFFGGGGRAPGADDNASGIATITEVIRILMNNNFKPKRTIQFMGYAAEEVGLLGSKDIAASYKAKGAQVVGVMQLDMTLYKGTADKDIVLMSDYTNQAQNEFIGKLVDEYVKVPWGYSRCGYGCSDHASWTANGYPASIPFEATMDESNKRIHTAQDTLETSGGDAKHAAKFAKLATAFVVELAN
ncbi:M28 family metallopeptidase [Peredibacter starrii]|uniref:M28 family metallopeptidase n=1 Tax=Peredibacter starrii TaxID=28202 RepID=A0AAX4HRU8_9BACT|nr:M28 family metallopeptidase [Peredibacter starrii]WPU65962.1 M28 family metallopeptidase [Peredibacter starrii]